MKQVLFCLNLFCVAVSPLFARTDESSWDATRGLDRTHYVLRMHERHQKELTVAELGARTASEDVGEIAVMTGDSRTLIKPNRFDLQGEKISFLRNSDGTYGVQVSTAGLFSRQGTAVVMGDDDSLKQDLPFEFPFYGRTRSSVFINSDGNLTFRKGDHAHTDRDVFRVLDGPPRIALFFADLDPSVGGEIKVYQSSKVFRVTWNAVPEFGKFNSNTFQVTFYKNGDMDLVYGSTVDGLEAIVGISPGNTDSTRANFVNYSKEPALTNEADAVLERFAPRSDVDFAALLQEFHQTHLQVFDFVVVFTDRPYLGRFAFAFFLPIQNFIRGIGLPRFDMSNAFGSPQVQGVLMMDYLAKYPDDPSEVFLGTNSTLSVMGQENGHRWLSYVQAMIDGVNSTELLGRDDAHWSFFMDTDASVMEGNDLQDNGNGTFTTVASTQKYSRLDRYLMGLIPPTRVLPFFFVRGAAGDPGRSPEVGVMIAGTRVDVSVNQIIQAEGPRDPSSSDAQKTFREAFIYFVRPGTTVTSSELAKIDNIRKQWQAFFHAATAKKGTLDTTLP